MGEERPTHEGAAGRRVVYCLVPYELAPKLHESLRRHFRDRPDVEVVVERREADRRSGSERRAAASESPAGRRRIRSTTGRRIADRRAAQVPAERPVLPRRAARYADRIAFVERLEPSIQELEDRDTARVVMRFQSADREAAFTELYRRYFDRVYAYLRVAFRSTHEAEDATQQVFMQVLQKLPDYERRAQPFRSWLFAIVRNHAVSHLRREHRIDVVDPTMLGERHGAAAVEEAAERLDPQIMSWITDRDLSVLMERLPLAQRQVLLLRFGFGLTSREVAQILEREPSDVRMLQHRALEYLRTRLAAFRASEADPVGRRRNRSCRRPVRRAEVMRSRRYALM